MPEKRTVERARRDKRTGKAPTTQAGEFVREEIHHIRQGKHGAKSTKQAIAMGLSKARRAGVKLRPPSSSAKPKTKRSAAYASRAGRHAGRRRPSPRRSRATSDALKREGRAAASRPACASGTNGVTASIASRSAFVCSAGDTHEGRSGSAGRGTKGGANTTTTTTCVGLRRDATTVVEACPVVIGIA